MQPLLSIFGHIWTKSEISDLERLEFFQFDETLNIFSYRADTSIPATFVAICAVDQKPVAYLGCFLIHFGQFLRWLKPFFHMARTWPSGGVMERTGHLGTPTDHELSISDVFGSPALQLTVQTSL